MALQNIQEEIRLIKLIRLTTSQMESNDNIYRHILIVIKLNSLISHNYLFENGLQVYWFCRHTMPLTIYRYTQFYVKMVKTFCTIYIYIYKIYNIFNMFNLKPLYTMCIMVLGSTYIHYVCLNIYAMLRINANTHKSKQHNIELQKQSQFK